MLLPGSRWPFLAFPLDVYDLLRPAIHTNKEAVSAALLLLDEVLHCREPPPLRLGMDDLTDPPAWPPSGDDAGDAPAARV